ATKNFPGKIRWWAETVEVVLVLILIPSAMIFDFTAPARFQEEWRANRDAALDREIERREADHADFERRNQIQRDFLNEWANSRTSGNDDLHEGTTQVLIDRLETRLIFPTVLHDFILQTDSESRSEILDLTRSLSDPYRSLENLGDRGAEAERFLPILDRIGASDPHPTVAKSAKKSAQWIRQRVQEDNKLPPSARRERFG
ncbi:MAG TPA: hypothetical protein VFV87_12520, partial [Pirellulaceae bacterium]|nr:hypothetical protein [Pirellulaceae bacterium]